MKKLLFILILFLTSCHYNPNWRINRRTPPVIVVAIDPDSSSVVLRDGDNKVFTIFDNPTSYAIAASFIEGDTLRYEKLHRNYLPNKTGSW